MNKDELINKVRNEKYTCIVQKDGAMFDSNENGIKPLMKWLDEDKNFFAGGEVVDKIVGKAAALLFVFGKAKSVYGKIMSESAAKVLAANNIPYDCESLVAFIENRTKTGMCPMEATVIGTDNPAEAYDLLRKKLAEMAQR